MRSGSAQWCAHLAGTRGHLAQPTPQPGGRLSHTFSEQRRNGKAQSVRERSRRVHLSVTPLPQNASFREIVPPECAFPYGTGCRMRFSVECAFPHLGKRRAASRKSAFCALGLTKKCSLCVGPHGKVQSAPSTSRKSAFCARAVAQNAPFREVRPQAEVRGPGATPPQPGGRLPGRICPVGPLSIVPRVLAGGCLAPPPGDDVTERRTLYASH